MQKVGMKQVSFTGVLVHNCTKPGAIVNVKENPLFSEIPRKILDEAVIFEKEDKSVKISLDREKLGAYYSKRIKDPEKISRMIRQGEASFDARCSIIFENKGKKCDYIGLYTDLFNIFRGIYGPNLITEKDIW